MRKLLLLLLFLCPLSSFAQLQIGGNIGGTLNFYDYSEGNYTGYVCRVNAAYIVSDAVKVGLGYRRSNALDKPVNSVGAFVDFGGHFGKMEAYAGPELGYFPYHGMHKRLIANTVYSFNMSGFGLELGARAGCNYQVCKRLAINAQGGYMVCGLRERTERSTAYQNSRWEPKYSSAGGYRAFELSLGLRYTIKFKEKNEDMSLPN